MYDSGSRVTLPKQVVLTEAIPVLPSGKHDLAALKSKN